MSLFRIGFISVVLVLVGCTTSPTGRNTIRLYSSAQMNQMGADAFSQLKSDIKISNTPTQNRYVECVARHIVNQLDDSDFTKWEVVVFADDQVNAFALPGGKIGIYTGILKVAKTQGQLAAIIGHEVGHVLAGHANERMSSSTLIQGGLVVADSASRAYSPENAGMIMAGLGLFSQVGIQLPFSRTHESEADIIGLQLMAKAGFDPAEAPKLWQNMQAAAGPSRQPEFLSTHPSPRTRIERLQNAQASVRDDYRNAPVKPNCR